ncbi:MAG TPA: DUF1192 domain-containing protein [Hyphomicrobiaceae bacterium]|jgi:uncharacterized small protein (DUF1192 family)|nr:MAG: DUF1192 domain-containing protein [Pseudomonadota bacterium]HEX5600097.1 DUF1192 domain-containing protein [Hyphomicrobiaceae bacterium]
MDWDEVRPKAHSIITVGEPLHELSVSDLEERLAALREEIRRVEKEIEAKRAHEKAASALFKR